MYMVHKHKEGKVENTHQLTDTENDFLKSERSRLSVSLGSPCGHPANILSEDTAKSPTLHQGNRLGIEPGHASIEST